MRCRDLFVMQHPEADLEMTILQSCPHDFGIKAKTGDLCMQDRVLGLQDCRKCWEQEAEDRMNWRNLYCPLCSNRGKIVWGKQVFCEDCETADKPVRFKEERVMDTGASLPVRTPQAPAEEAEE